VLRRSRQPVEFRNNQRVAFSNKLQRCIQLGALGYRRNLLFKYLLAAQIFEVTPLSFEASDLING